MIGDGVYSLINNNNEAILQVHHLWCIYSLITYVKNNKRQTEKEKYLNWHPHGSKHQRLQSTLSYLPTT